MFKVVVKDGDARWDGVTRLWTDCDAVTEFEDSDLVAALVEFLQAVGDKETAILKYKYKHKKAGNE